MSESSEVSLSRVEFWQRLAAFAFAAWAAVVGFVGVVVKETVSDAVNENKIAREAFTEYVRVMERRVTVIEERQATVLRRLDSLENGRAPR